jgi:hypothetical protein
MEMDCSISFDIRAEAESEAAAPPIAEAIVARLRESAPLFHASCPFKPEDLVIARKDAGVDDFLKRQPSIVLDVLRNATFSFAPTARQSVGYRNDLRLLILANDDLIPALFDSAQFEPFPRAVDAAAEAATEEASS